MSGKKKIFFVRIRYLSAIGKHAFAQTIGLRQRSARAPQVFGISESTSSRERTSSLRLVSCVEVASMEYGQLSARLRLPE